jgi:hypothetical protein
MLVAHASLTQTVETKQHRQRRVVVVVLLRREQEHTKLRAVQAACVGRVHLRPTDVMGRIGADPSVDVGEPVEPAPR